MSTPSSASLLHRTIGVFGVLVLILLLFFKLGSVVMPKHVPEPHQDKRALEAMKTLEKSVRPLNAETRRLTSEEAVKQVTGCSDEAKDILAHVLTLERRMGRMAGLTEAGEIQGNHRLSKVLVVDASAWQAALVGRSFSCADLVRGLGLLARNEGAPLEGLEWRGVTHARIPEGQWLFITERVFQRVNPWGGLPGCILLSEGDGWYVSNGRNNYCAEVLQGKRKPASDQDAVVLPDSLAGMLADVQPLRLPADYRYRDVTQPEEGRHGPNRLALEGNERDVGFHIRLTLDPNAQRIAQQAARCYTGHTQSCKDMGLSEAAIGKIGADFYEHAAVRMTGVAIVDVTSGRIEALASAHSDCYRQQYDGPGRDAHCPDLTREARYNPDMLLNHAVYSDAMPASTVKPILALGFLQTPGYGVDDADLTRELKYSLSEAFLNRLYCLDTNTRAQDCHRLEWARTAAGQVGWNVGCTPGGEDCGFAENLFGRNATDRLAYRTEGVRPLGLRTLYGRLFTAPFKLEDGKTNRTRSRLMTDDELKFAEADAKVCQAKEWEKCSGNAVANVVSEGWGQGSARSTALGVAGAYARLGAARLGLKQHRRPYLVEGVLDVHGEALQVAGVMAGDPEVLTIPAEAATRVIDGLRQGHRSGHPRDGTSHAGCVGAGIGDCDQVDWVAGKTGTPPFGFDKIPLEEAKKLCAQIDAIKDPKERAKTQARCKSEIPYKWYAALFQSGKSAEFDKAIAVLSERNWYLPEATLPENMKWKRQGKVDSPGDNGPNRSAELAFRIMNQLRLTNQAESKPAGRKP